MTRSTRTRLLPLLACLTLAACGGSSADRAAITGITRGAITARSGGTITVNGVSLSTSGATVRIDGQVASAADLGKGMVVTVKGSFDDRSGAATEIEYEHGLEGQVDDKGTDWIRVGGQLVHVDGSTEFGDDRPGRLDDVSIDDAIAVSGVPDDKGGLRASRIDDSPRDDDADPSDDDDFDLKGFVSSLQAGSFELRLSPDSAAWFVVDTSGIASLPAGLADGAFVEVHALAPATPGIPPVLGTIVASSIEVEDRFGGAEAEVEVEGIVTSGDSAEFVVDGLTVRTDGATRFELGAPAELVPGVKVEAEGRLDAEGVLHAEKVSFRPGARITGPLAEVAWDGVSGTATILGLPVQLPSFADIRVAPADGLVVELRGNPSAGGAGVVALRLEDKTGESRVFVRAVVTAKADTDPAAPTFTVLGFTVTTAGAEFRDASDAMMTAGAFFAAVEPGRTVVKVRAASLAEVSGGTIHAEELELEGLE